MAEQLLLLFAGFLLTTVLGGVLGYAFQNRAWNHQHDVERSEERRRRALGVFEELSTLMDRRIYRMRQVAWVSRDAMAKGEPTDDLRAARDAYRAVLRDWNDNLNRSLALVQASFGDGIRRSLEGDLYERFSSIGRGLDDHLRRVASGQGTQEDATAIGRRLTRLAHEVYDLDVAMLQRIHDDRLDEDALPTFDTLAREAARPALELGDQGSAVRRLQDALRRAGHVDLMVDGDFGRATWSRHTFGDELRLPACSPSAWVVGCRPSTTTCAERWRYVSAEQFADAVGAALEVVAHAILVEPGVGGRAASRKMREHERDAPRDVGALGTGGSDGHADHADLQSAGPHVGQREDPRSIVAGVGPVDADQSRSGFQRVDVALQHLGA